MEEKSVLVFFVNGKKIVEENVNPEWTVLQYLRNKLRLCGTKLGCGEGGCGACTIMVSKYDRKQDKIIHFPVNACLAPICSVHGLAITTVEGIGSTRTKLHPVQERIAKSHGSQCGFCTPGIVMSMYTLLRTQKKLHMEDLDVTFQGNLCRCTGYRPIIEGYKTFTEEYELMQFMNKLSANCDKSSGTICNMGKNCCQYKDKNSEDPNLFDSKEFTPYDNSQEPIFPPELKLNCIYDQEDLKFTHGESTVTWYRPTRYETFLKLKETHSGAKIIVGNTEVGVEVKFKYQNYPVLIAPTMIEELTSIKVHENGVTIGSGVTLEEINSVFKNLIQAKPEFETRILKAVVEMLHWFAGKQIRSVASIGGNIMTASPISDLNLIWIAIKAKAKLKSTTSKRIVTIDNNFFPSYRKTSLETNEILESIEVPFTKRNQFIFAHKQSRRRDDDIAIVNTAIYLVLTPENKIDEIEFAFGGLGPTTFSTKSTKQLIGLPWDENMFEIGCSKLFEDTPLSADVPGGMVDYRRTLALSFFFRTYITMRKILYDVIEPCNESAISKFGYRPPMSNQFFEISEETKTPVGKPIVHMSALKQATGEAIYIDDIPHIEGELHMGLVYTTKAHAKIKNVDFASALELKGVFGHVSAEDIPKERNKLGCVVQDEELFVTNLVTSENQVIGAILAEDQSIAQKAARMVKIEYEELPCIVTIDEAILNNSFFPIERKIEIGNVPETFKNAKHIIEGVCRTGYQEHFYLETHACLAIPKETDEFELFASNQNHAETTDFVSRILNIPQHKITTRIKRIGGGFGGKQSRGTPIAMATAIAAQKYNKPVRLILDRDEDMAMSGGRHPYVVKYKVAFSDDGTINALDVQLFANGGYSHDLSIEVLERAVFHVENCYKIQNLKVVGKICKTNLPTNTAFRGFGAPQAMFAVEIMTREIAEFLGISHIDVVFKNLYREGDTTHYTQKITNCNLTKCLEECLQKSDYYKRLEEVKHFNKENKWKKRGISVVTTKYGVGFGVPFLEQSGCLINIYTDGSVLLTFGGVEMGQGLNTKMIQIVANVLGISPDIIHVNESATDKVPNSSPTAASVGSDLNGMAVLKACETLKSRLAPLRNQHPDNSWKEIINKAYFSRVNLSAVGHFATPDVDYNWETNSGTPYNYFTFGSSCTTVEIDCLTGDHQVLRTDIVMDLGSSLNPAIDIGQIEGAFMQGYGLFVLEEMIYSPKGTVYSKGPGTYKIPGFSDIPIEFNVSLLKGTSNPRAVFSSKAVGEPPLFLASSAFFAIREAILAARVEQNVVESFTLDAPATAEKIRMLCVDKIIKQVCLNGPTISTWNVIP